MMEIPSLAFLPCLWVTWMCVGVITTLCMTLIGGHLQELVPYICSTGAYYPESVVFTVVFCISAVLGVLTMYVMYKRMTVLSSENGRPIAQIILLLAGWTTCAGMMILGIFQVKPYPTLHLIGTLLAIVPGTMYSMCQAFFLYTVSQCSKHLRRLRSVICAMAIITSLTLTASYIASVKLCHPGIVCVLPANTISAIGEWIWVTTLMLTILTYTPECQLLCMKFTCKLDQDWICPREKVHAGPEYP
ncbi:DNA damage-regulated autophagy modulator protein 1-like [Pseudophryne corroboree]|uniref:DNA damage-regulated autophagy modulator protein 1-like n=1 Tax=Pseudophryne corroboree TaxID=495146 RepID=UPI0030817667